MFRMPSLKRIEVEFSFFFPFLWSLDSRSFRVLRCSHASTFRYTTMYMYSTGLRHRCGCRLNCRTGAFIDLLSGKVSLRSYGVPSILAVFPTHRYVLEERIQLSADCQFATIAGGATHSFPLHRAVDGLKMELSHKLSAICDS